MISLIFPICLHAAAMDYVLCEGNFMAANATLWTVNEEEELNPVPQNPIGDTGQSLYVHEQKLYAVMNGSGSIEVFNIDESDGSLEHSGSIDTEFSGPRYMAFANGNGYVTQWNTQNVGVINLESDAFTGSIPVNGMPEYILYETGLLYVSIVMNSDWSDGELVVVIDPAAGLVVDEINVGSGPGAMLVHENRLYISRTYYDGSWNMYAAASRLDLGTGDLIQADYGQTWSYGADLLLLNDSVYRMVGDGIAPLSENLEIVASDQIGNFPGLYSASTDGQNLYFGISDDYFAPDELVITDAEGTVLNSYNVGALPGSFAFWNTDADTECEPSGDVNEDGSLDILDIVTIVAHIVGNIGFSDYEICLADMNEDGAVNVLDIMILLGIIQNA